MNLTFRIRFCTQPGQSLALHGTHPLPTHPVPMEYRDREHWQVEIPLVLQAFHTPFTYHFSVRHGEAVAVDWGQGQDRQVRIADFKCTRLLVIDTWNNPAFHGNAQATAPFKTLLPANQITAVHQPAPKFPTHTFRVKAPLLDANQTLCLLGEGPVLGQWRTAQPILLNRMAGQDYLSVQLDLRLQAFPFRYKYGIWDVRQQRFLRYETGGDRVLQDQIARDKHTLVNDGFVRLPDDTWRGTGVAVPVFSLRSEKSFGVGEFLDLIPLADWARQAGLKLIQLLPVNDTTATHTWQDTCPYAAISAFALHPLYLNLAELTEPAQRKGLKALEPQRLKLNRLKTVDYEAVLQEKLAYLRKLFPKQKSATFRTPAYRAFVQANEAWLRPYAAFCALRDKFGTADFSQWPDHSHYHAAAITAWSEKNPEVAFHFFVQFHLHRQLQLAATAVRARGLVLKGDIPIGIQRRSADTWQHPEWFHLDQQTGMHPDVFSARGQNWGFPTYHWQNLAKDGFGWWRRRLAHLENYFDAVRLDHLPGFFRTWSIPVNAVEGVLGHFDPAHPLDRCDLTDRGIHLDLERLTRPFITDGVLEAITGGLARTIRRDFLQPTGNDAYQLKPKFGNQRLVEKYFAALETTEANQKLKAALFDLLSDVILIEVHGKFHFRFGMAETESFKNLEPGQQTTLLAMYQEYFLRQEPLWLREGMQRLSTLKRHTRLLLCGETLPPVPGFVTEVLHDLGILGLTIQRLPRHHYEEFAPLRDVPYLTVVTPSTHDTSNLREWWAENPERRRRYYHHLLLVTGETPAEASPETIATILQHHLASPAMWSIFAIQDLLALDEKLRPKDPASERINVPGTLHYWRYRLPVTLEKLGKAKAFNERLAGMVKHSGR